MWKGNAEIRGDRTPGWNQTKVKFDIWTSDMRIVRLSECARNGFTKRVKPAGVYSSS